MKLIAAIALAVSIMAPRVVMAGAWDVGPPVGATVPALHATDLKGVPVGGAISPAVKVWCWFSSGRRNGALTAKNS